MAKKAVLNAGHGGTDPGTSANGIVKKGLTLKISNYIHNRLDDLGIDNSIYLEQQMKLYHQKLDLVEYKVFMVKVTTLLLFSNHINAGGET